MTQSGTLWKKQRRYLNKALSGEPIVRRDYSALMIKYATILVKSILDHPENFLWEVKKMAGQVVIEVGYGATGDDEDGGHDYIDMQIELAIITAKAIQGYWVDELPWLKHIPTWFPGAQFKRDGSRWRTRFDTIRNYMFETVRKPMLSEDQGASLPPSFVRNTLRDLYSKPPPDAQQLREEEEAIKYELLSLFRQAKYLRQDSLVPAGSDTLG
ncbi:hypothetical protein FRC00_007240 [Tulasnella sp. 408]|nr:hypothetical protein FRC00_007240 [Tulasnella sp. 408]